MAFSKRFIPLFLRLSVGNRLKTKDPANDRVFASILLRGKTEFPYAAAVRGKTMR